MSNSPPRRPCGPGAFLLRSPHAMRGGRATGEASPHCMRATIVSSSVPQNGEGAKRREALVRIAAPFACHDAARVGRLTRRPAPRDVGRSPLGASPRRLSAAGPDARLLWHHSLGMVPRRWVVVPRGGIPWPPERRMTQNPARRRRSRLRSSGLSPPEAPSSSRDGRRLAPQFWKAETNRRLARSYPQAAFLIFEKSLVPDQLGRSMERMSFL